MGKYQIQYTTGASNDVGQAVLWYDEQQIGLGEKFLAELNHRTKTISEMPEVFGIKSRKKYREAKLNKFPFRVMYRLYPRKKIVLIVGVIHERRSPNAKFSDAE